MKNSSVKFIKRKIDLKLIYSISILFICLILSSCKLYEDNEFDTFQGKLLLENGSPAENIEIVFTNERTSGALGEFSWDDSSNGIYRGKTDDRGLFRFVVPKRNFEFSLSAANDIPSYFLYVEPSYIFQIESENDVTESKYLFLIDFSKKEGVLDLSSVIVKPI